MKRASFNMLLETVSKDNIIVFTTACSTACIFCSHHQNPVDIEAFNVSSISLEEADTLIEFVDPSRKIIIGESATRICEGEPFLNNNALEILKRIRKKYPKTGIQITTSGVPLVEDMLVELKRLGGIELNLSLNSCTKVGRKLLYRGRSHTNAVDLAAKLSQYGLPFNGSIVAMPHLVGWKDIEETVRYLSKTQAQTIRIFMPGYTKLTKGMLPPEDIREELEAFVLNIREKVDTPVLLEPAFIRDLTAVVEGVISGSPAKEAHMKAGDKILTINTEAVSSRVDAYYKLFKAPQAVVECQRGDQRVTLEIRKKAKTPSGAVFNYDIHPELASLINRTIRKYRGKHGVLLTSELGYDVLKHVVEPIEHFRLEKVKNSYFGGNILCAGLLTLEDLAVHIQGLKTPPDIVLIPSLMLDGTGKDLRGVHYKTIEEKLKVQIQPI